jgi:acetyltransferase EpsM
MAKQVAIIGSGAQAKYALETFHLLGVDVAGIVSLEGESPPEELDGAPLIGDLEGFFSRYEELKRPGVIVTASSNEKKMGAVRSLSALNPEFVSAVHPNAVIARTAKVGMGTIINAGAVVQPFATVGSHCMVHAGVIVEHDCVLGDFVNIAPGARLCGYVKVGEGAVVFTGANVAPTVSIGERATVAAGAVVLEDVEAGSIVAGSPATKRRGS